MVEEKKCCFKRQGLSNLITSRHATSNQVCTYNEAAETSTERCSNVIYLGPVVQSIVSLTSSLRGQIVVFYYFITKYTNIFVEKMREAFFNKKYWHILDINV